jgi:hypothetical protein
MNAIPFFERLESYERVLKIAYTVDDSVKFDEQHLNAILISCIIRYINTVKIIAVEKPSGELVLYGKNAHFINYMKGFFNGEFTLKQNIFKESEKIQNLYFKDILPIYANRLDDTKFHIHVIKDTFTGDVSEYINFLDSI